ncbi:hypothetical protein KC335_g121 [Hortaea werneckii]|nr:hypothetical protein KC335_g121 [Hortaea werneckii]
MASLPARQQSQPRRRSSPSRQSQTSPSPTLARSEDSQTLFVNSPDRSQTEESSQLASQPQPVDRDSDPNIQKCWICFSDSTEDTPETSPWRDPCPCALVAHEECLLDWIADAESPSNARRARAGGFGGPRIECPQCKHEIKLARPWNPLVEAVRGMERIGARSVTPGALSVLSGILWNASSAWGVHSIYAIFGPEDGFRILRPWVVDSIRVVRPEDALHEVGRAVLHCAVHWRLYIGLPLITPVLVLSRTRFADSVLPVLPILFFATQTHAVNDGTLNFTSWPPSASLSFAVLPYIRSAYNYYYEKVRTVTLGLRADSSKERKVAMQTTSSKFASTVASGKNGATQRPRKSSRKKRTQASLNRTRSRTALHRKYTRQRSMASRKRAPPTPTTTPAPAATSSTSRRSRPKRRWRRRRSRRKTPLLLSHRHRGNRPRRPPLPHPRRPVRRTAQARPPALLDRAGPQQHLRPRRQFREKWGRSLVGGCLFVVVKDCVMLEAVAAVYDGWVVHFGIVTCLYSRDKCVFHLNSGVVMWREHDDRYAATRRLVNNYKFSAFRCLRYNK